MIGDGQIDANDPEQKSQTKTVRNLTRTRLARLCNYLGNFPFNQSATIGYCESPQPLPPATRRVAGGACFVPPQPNSQKMVRVRPPLAGFLMRSEETLGVDVINATNATD